MLTLSMVPSDPNLVELIGALNSIGSGMGFRNTERAMSALSGAVARAWQTSVGSDHRIQRKKVTPFTHSVYSTDKVVHWLEYGLKPFDMKMTHPFGRKSRVVKPRVIKGKVVNQWTQKRKDGSTYTVRAGDPYLIIPFRHRTKNSKGQAGQKTLEDAYSDVQEQMQGDFERSKVTVSAAESGKVSPNHWKFMVQRAQYSWGTRLQFPDTEEYKNLQGLVVMGSKGQTQFMNFRIVSVNSPEGSWMQLSGIKARHYLENILNRGQEQMQTVIEDALKRDLGT